MQTELGFAKSAPNIAVADRLAEFLGVLKPGGTFEYTYEDAVKLSGHSCPTVARAFLMTIGALRELYPSETPVRGEIEVTIGGDPLDGATGPMAMVVGLITGAAPETGFGGLMGRWERRNLLCFEPELAGRMRFRRKDTGAAVEVSYDGSAVPVQPELPRLMSAALGGHATAEEQREFARLWQARVERMLSGELTRSIRVEKVDGRHDLERRRAPGPTSRAATGPRR